MPRMIESNCLIYWINHFSTHTSTYSNKPKFCVLLFVFIFFYRWFGSLNSQKKSVCSPQLFLFFVHLSIAQTKHDHANDDDFQQTNTSHTHSTHSVERRRKKTNPNQRNRVLCFRACTKNEFQYLWSKIYSNLCSTRKCLCLVSTKLANNLRFGFFPLSLV